MIHQLKYFNIHHVKKWSLIEFNLISSTNSMVFQPFSFRNQNTFPRPMAAWWRLFACLLIGPSTRCSLQYKYLQTFATITHNQTRQLAQTESNCYGQRQRKTNSAMIVVSFLSWTFSVSKNIVKNMSNKWTHNWFFFKTLNLFQKANYVVVRVCWQ